MAITSPAITEFQLSCQKYFICYSISSLGLRERAKQLASCTTNLDADFIVGSGHPDNNRWHAVMRKSDVIEGSQPNGTFPDRIAKAFITAMYSEWDEVYRPRIAVEAQTDSKAVKSDLMGDLRLIRHCIVHKKSCITDEHEKLKELNWSLAPRPLTVTKEMFTVLIDQINHMTVRIEP